ncbi:methyltransferase [Nevskia sp.]|uniref:methyltransferase n=1 Tax=Nevskia sp. TaxID=1929292 RepID=UPI0025E2754F|nr:methyltransferase [Nevskia sp.]
MNPLHADPATAVVVLLILAGYASWGWGARHFFTKPTGTNSGIDAIYLLSNLLGLYVLAGLPVLGVASSGHFAAAAILLGLSLSLFWWAIAANRRKPLSFAFSEDLPEHLVAEGPYRYIRHPFYTSYLLTWLAAGVATGSAFMALPFAVMAPMYFTAARVEERKFSSTALNRDYDRYRAGTGMFLPWPFSSRAS